jgi:methylated-DNA-[protein]-cysteine S-methyltransferase
MTPEHYCLFGTDFGTCGLAWSQAGITRLQLPESSPADTERRICAGGATLGDPSSAEARAAEDLRRYFRGEPIDFASIVLDLGAIHGFQQEIYLALRQVGYGETVTYGELAAHAGSPGAARTATIAIVLLALIGELLPVLSMAGSFASAGATGFSRPELLVYPLWKLVTFPLLCAALFVRKPFAWASLLGVLFVYTAGVTAGFALLVAYFVAHRNPPITVPMLLCLTVTYAGTVGLFRARMQYGVEQRGAWRTLWRVGGWSIILSAFAEATALLWFLN